MDTLCILTIAEFGSIVCLNDLGRIAKVENGPLHKVHR